MPRRALNLVAALAGGLAALVGPAPASGQLRAVALAGQVAPGTGGGTYASFGSVDVAKLSEVVFSATVSGGTTPGGLFFQSPLRGDRTIARVGDVVPGDLYPYPVTFAEFQGATLAGNQVAFLATFEASGQPAGEGIFVADAISGGMTLVAKIGDPSPTGDVFRQLRVPSNHCGDVVFGGAAGPSELALTRGIFRSTGGVVSAVAVEGDPAPDCAPATFVSFGDPDCNSAFSPIVGFSAIMAFFPDPPFSAVFRYAGGTGTLVAVQEDFSPDGVPYGAFSAERPGTTSGWSQLGYTDGAGLFLSPGSGSGGPARVMARLGQTAPGTGGGTFVAFPRSPTLMSTDTGAALVAFAELSGGSAPSGVFQFGTGFVGRFALVGDPAPGTGGGTYASFSRPATADATFPGLGDSGVVGFAAEVSGGTASSGVFVLPEPGALVAQLACAALLALLGARRGEAP